MKQRQYLSMYVNFLVISLSFLSIANGQSSSVNPSAGKSVTTQAASQTSVTKIKADELEKKPFTLSIGAENSQKVAADERGQRESSTDYVLALGYKVSDLVSFSAKGGITKENTGPGNTLASNTAVAMGIKGYKVNEELITVHSILGVLPTSEASQKTDRLKGAVGISNGIRYVIPFGSFEYRLGLSKNVHEYNFNAEGSANIEYSLSNSMDIKIPVTEKFSISALGKYKNARTYGGFERSAFELHGDLNYDFTENFGVNLGTSNEGAGLKANGVDSNIAAYNENTSVYRAGLSYTY
ncbi:MAG: hypothetical protein WA160_02060 [Pseudobdellovibrio sp.]